MDLTQIKNIIFDLGGVIINIDYNKSIQELQKLCKDNCNVAFSQKEQSHLFDLYETGVSSSDEFRNNLRETYKIEATDEQIDHAWNAMLLDIPKERIDLLLELGKKYRIYLLSNTNAIHMKRFNEIVEHSFTIPSLDSLFEQSYYSHLIGQRKPNAPVFEMILEQNGLKREETLFIDDSIQHIESAKKIGLQTLHLQPPLTINQVFQDGV
ncbi:putative hydrolase of the HAD superfamily [Pontibacter ummariensis]|uniref:Putative hydrolase of the HAD superfamily n=1 Tax=Pontibacter ummariensis TaxID=1610492 RepID=A0A239ES64_9BACT|nr:HAD family phosphatase [Pontibacter ummariensis]PRY12804.1 putative hydrolase of the HAD superfamily [Pontibacter ummariensis]SNS46752.1 putative hydrolase of the HAD superfamily [Pontibacter ummariensis]